MVVSCGGTSGTVLSSMIYDGSSIFGSGSWAGVDIEFMKPKALIGAGDCSSGCFNSGSVVAYGIFCTSECSSIFGSGSGVVIEFMKPKAFIGAGVCSGSFYSSMTFSSG